ncbi:hypothetical protein JOD82_002146 [Paenibacillus sp. 1182]|uniref:hypothetical protein n=1 Tax=Paenibacillus sp. 1182 TaxID=2806565 RepID=UPI001AE31684|nr:hypothetical protein [Paenibacillus sp. 1182]MBP1309126.1 hypothetical protein [Paenibacillus sp. 1182]
MLTAILSFIIFGIVLINSMFQLREGRDERGRSIMFNPLNLSFALLLVGYAAINIVDTLFHLSFSTYKDGVSILFAGVLIFYIVFLFIERKRLS